LQSRSRHHYMQYCVWQRLHLARLAGACKNWKEDAMRIECTCKRRAGTRHDCCTDTYACMGTDDLVCCPCAAASRCTRTIGWGKTNKFESNLLTWTASGTATASATCLGCPLLHLLCAGSSCRGGAATALDKLRLPSSTDDLLWSIVVLQHTGQVNEYEFGGRFSQCFAQFKSTCRSPRCATASL
jgi:hypothetical protein